MRRSFALIASVRLLAAPAVAGAQVFRNVRRPQPSRVFLGLSGLMAVPRDEFSTYVDNGYGGR